MVFRFLGMVAALDARLSGNSLNLYAVRALLLFVLAVSAIVGIRDLRPAPPMEEPRRVSLADLMGGKVPVGSLVAVDGVVDPSSRIGGTTRRWLFGRRRVQSLQSKWDMLPLVDESRSGLLTTLPSETPRGRVTLIGTVTPLTTTARETLARDRNRLPGWIHPDLMLVDRAATQPSTALSVAMAAIGTPSLALLLYLRLKRGLVFRARPDVDAAEPHEVREVDLRLTGRLRRDTGAARHFLEMPAQAAIDARGNVVLGQHIDASLYLYEWCVRRRVGFWSVSIRRGGLGTIVRGEVAMGTGVRPAMRVRVEDGDGRFQTLTLSFATVAQREHVVRVLTHYCGQPIRDAA